MNILYHHRTQAVNAEGVHIRQLVAALRHEGNEVFAVSPPGIDLDTPATAHKKSGETGRWKLITRNLPAALFEILELLYNWAGYRRCARICRAQRVDLVYERYAFFCWVGMKIARKRNIPLFLEVNYTTLTPLFRKKTKLFLPLARHIERRCFEQAQALFVVSSYLKRQLIDCGIPEEKIIVTPNAVDEQVFSHAADGAAIRDTFKLSGRQVIGYVGAFFPWHGLDFLLDAIARLETRRNDMCLFLVGSGPMEKTLREAARQKQLKTPLVFAGTVPYNRLPEYLAAMDMCVLPDSNDYGSPMKIFEYMAVGKPVLAPKLSPIEDVITDGVNGVLFPQKDLQAFALKLDAVLSDDSLKKRVGQAARETIARKHYWRHNAQAIIRAFEGNKPATPPHLKLTVIERLRRWILAHQDNRIVVVASTVMFAEPLLMSFYERNRHKNISWQGKKSCITISFDCDYPRDVEALPFVLDMLKPYPFKSSFACVGHWIERYPKEHRMILEHGHEIVNHTYSHPDNELLNPGRKFRTIPRDEKKAEIRQCHEVCIKTLGYEPVGCRIPHFKNLFTPDIYGILKELGYRYSSSTWLTNTPSDGLPFRAECDILEFPLSTCPRHPFTVFDTWHSLESKRLFYRAIHRGPQAYCALLRRLIDTGIATGSYVNIYIDPYDLKRIPSFDGILQYVAKRADDIWVAPYKDILKTL